MAVDEVNEAHFERLRAIDRLYDTGKIDYDDMTRRERAEEKRYDKEIEQVTDRLDAFYRDHVARTNPDPRKDEPILEPAVLHRDGAGGRIPEWRRRAMTTGIARDETGRI